MLQSINEKCSPLKSKITSSLSIALVISRKPPRLCCDPFLWWKLRAQDLISSDFRVTMDNIVCVCIPFAVLFMFLLDNESHHGKRTESCSSVIMQFLASQFLHLLTYSEGLEGVLSCQKNDMYFLIRIWILPRAHLLDRGLVCPPQNCQLRQLLKNKHILSTHSCTTCGRATRHRKEENNSERW